MELINKISIQENIFFDSNNTIEKLINFSQNDIRRLINLFEELSYHIKNDRLITNNLLDIFISKSRYKNINIGLFYSTERILNNYLDYETIYNLYEIEKVLLPLMIHENYLKNINDNPDNLNKIQNISELLSIGENIETSIYTDQNWFLQTIHGFYTCIYTSYWINKIDKNKNKNICFSSDLNKTSLKNINRKNINNLIKIISNKSIFEILMLNKICNYFVLNNKQSEFIQILKNYNNISIKEIDLFLKIDKTTKFNILSSKDKKKIIKIIN
jgi:hypothetical protein